MKKGDYTIGDIYEGSYSTLDPYPNLSPINYPLQVKSFGAPTDPRTANILKETSDQLSTGIKHIEVSMVSPEVAESIPQQLLKEVNRQAKLVGAEVSVHGPIIEPSGISDQGFSETGRKSVERQMMLAVERSYEISPDGNIPVTFHSSARIPDEIVEKGKIPEKVIVINTESGSIGGISLRKGGGFPGEPEYEDPIKGINNLNEREWSEKRRTLNYYINLGESSIKQHELLAIAANRELEAGKELTQKEKEAINSYNAGAGFLDDSYRQLKDLFALGVKHGSEYDKKLLGEFSKSITPKVDKIIQVNKDKNIYEEIRLKKEILDGGREVLKKVQPRIYQPLKDFAKEKTVDTLSNVAIEAYEKVRSGDWKSAPIISIENPPVGGAFSRGEDLKGIVEESRKKFVEKAVAKGVSESEARKQAEQILGVTWDVGHINMLRRYGYKSEDIVKEAEKIKPLLKHIHLSDNFGFEHTELPMGMGNVPIKEIMDKLGQEGYGAKKIIEAGNWWQHFSPGGKQNPPFAPTLQAFGSPIYAMKMAPYWNQSYGFSQNYYSGMGATLPQINYETFGGGFSQLPTELGGQRQGAEGRRTTGRPME